MKPAFLYLASRSPRRSELLTQAGIRFRVYVPQEEELSAPPKVKKSGPGSIVKAISAAKANAAQRELSGKGVQSGIILSADTLVFLEGKVLGKPANEMDAKRMLKRLSGRWHQVCTAVSCIQFEGKTIRYETIYASTRVKFFPLRKEWIDWYVSTGEPLDKAGSYGAQGHCASFIEKFSGSYTNVVGLPVGEALALVEKVSGLKRAELMGD